MNSKDLEGKGRVVMKVTSGHFAAVTEKDKKHQLRPSRHSNPRPLHKNQVLGLQSTRLGECRNTCCDVIVDSWRNVSLLNWTLVAATNTCSGDSFCFSSAGRRDVVKSDRSCLTGNWVHHAVCVNVTALVPDNVQYVPICEASFLGFNIQGFARLSFC